MENDDLDVDFEKRTKNMIETTLDPNNTNVKFQNLGVQGIFKIASIDSRFELDPEYFAMASTKYHNSASFITSFMKAYKLLNTLVKITEFSRIGLRYINLFNGIDLKEFKVWDEYIDSSFIPKYSSFNPLFGKFSLRKNLNEFIFSDGDYMINTKTSIWNKDFPSIITDHQFIIDIDCTNNSIIDSVTLEDKFQYMK